MLSLKFNSKTLPALVPFGVGSSSVVWVKDQLSKNHRLYNSIGRAVWQQASPRRINKGYLVASRQPALKLLPRCTISGVSHHTTGRSQGSRKRDISSRYGAGWEGFSESAPVAVWWDFENCNVPLSIEIYNVSVNIVHGLRSSGFKGPVSISAYGDTLQLSRTTQEALASTGIRLQHVPSGGKDASDRALLVDLILWTFDHPPPAHLLLISGDRDFSNALHRLRMRNYNILLACPSGPSVSPALIGAASHVWQWNSLVKGEGLLPATAPDGLPGKNLHARYGGPISHFPTCTPVSSHDKGVPGGGSHVESKTAEVTSVLPSGKPDPTPVSSLQSIAKQAAESGTSNVPPAAQEGKAKTGNLKCIMRQPPKKVLLQLTEILRPHPSGLMLSDFQYQIEEAKVNLDKDFYGYGKIVPFLSSIPNVLQVDRVIMKDNTSWSYKIMLNPVQKASLSVEYSHREPSVEDVQVGSDIRLDESTNSRTVVREPPEKVLEQLKALLSLHPSGMTVSELEDCMKKGMVNFDMDFYGYGKIMPFLSSMPGFVQVKPVSVTENNKPTMSYNVVLAQETGKDGLEEVQRVGFLDASVAEELSCYPTTESQEALSATSQLRPLSNASELEDLSSGSAGKKQKEDLSTADHNHAVSFEEVLEVPNQVLREDLGGEQKSPSTFTRSAEKASSLQEKQTPLSSILEPFYKAVRMWSAEPGVSTEANVKSDSFNDRRDQNQQNDETIPLKIEFADGAALNSSRTSNLQSTNEGEITSCPTELSVKVKDKGSTWKRWLFGPVSEDTSLSSETSTPTSGSNNFDNPNIVELSQGCEPSGFEGNVSAGPVSTSEEPLLTQPAEVTLWEVDERAKSSQSSTANSKASECSTGSASEVLGELTEYVNSSEGKLLLSRASNFTEAVNFVKSEGPLRIRCANLSDISAALRTSTRAGDYVWSSSNENGSSSRASRGAAAVSMLEFQKWFLGVVSDSSRNSSRPEEGYNLSMLKPDFEKTFGMRLDPRYYGFTRVQDLVASVPYVRLARPRIDQCVIHLSNASPDRVSQESLVDLPEHLRASSKAPDWPKMYCDCMILVRELMQENREGVLGSQLKPLFLSRFGYALDHKRVGFSKLSDMLRLMPEVVSVNQNVLVPSRELLRNSVMKSKKGKQMAGTDEGKFPDPERFSSNSAVAENWADIDREANGVSSEKIISGGVLADQDGTAQLSSEPGLPDKLFDNRDVEDDLYLSSGEESDSAELYLTDEKVPFQQHASQRGQMSSEQEGTWDFGRSSRSAKTLEFSDEIDELLLDDDLVQDMSVAAVRQEQVCFSEIVVEDIKEIEEESMRTSDEVLSSSEVSDRPDDVDTVLLQDNHVVVNLERNGTLLIKDEHFPCLEAGGEDYKKDHYLRGTLEMKALTCEGHDPSVNLSGLTLSRDSKEELLSELTVPSGSEIFDHASKSFSLTEAQIRSTTDFEDNENSSEVPFPDTGGEKVELQHSDGDMVKNITEQSLSVNQTDSDTFAEVICFTPVAEDTETRPETSDDHSEDVRSTGRQGHTENVLS